MYGKNTYSLHTLTQEKLSSPGFIRDMSVRFGLPMLDLDCFDKKLIPLALVDEALAQNYRLLPLYQRESRLYIAVDNPSCVDAINVLKFKTGSQIHCILVETHKLIELIKQILNVKRSKAIHQFTHQHLQASPILEKDNDLNHFDLLVDKEGSDPVINFINKIIFDAITRQASDIHFEPFEKYFQIRFRIDGVLNIITQNLSTELAKRIITRLKVLSNLDISENRLPHDGRCKMKLNENHEIDFRVSTCPTVNGEKIVMRILDSRHSQKSLDKLGMNPEQLSLYKHAIQRSQGMILVTGPTGSGKSATLYAALNFLNTSEKNISTVEDPVEIKISGINQVHINPKAGLNFTNVLRSFLRQDPDIIMIGEMRDFETADIAIKAAQTGHLVLSTLHTNSASSALVRLMNMNVAPYHITSSVTLIVAQRLIRKLCNHCKQPYQAPPATLHKYGFERDTIPSITLFKAVGCAHCFNGYRGRTAIFELLPISDSLCHKILNLAKLQDIEKQACQEGMISMREIGLSKIKQGITTLEEIARIIKD